MELEILWSRLTLACESSPLFGANARLAQQPHQQGYAEVTPVRIGQDETSGHHDHELVTPTDEWPLEPIRSQAADQLAAANR